MKKNILQRLICWIFAIWCVFLALLNLLQLVTAADTPVFVTLLALVCAAAVLAMCFLLGALLEKSPRWVAPPAVFLLALAVKALVIIFAGSEQYSDYLTFYRAASFISSGQTNFVRENPYWGIWSYQFGFPWLLSLFCRLFHTSSVTFCLAVNTAFSAGCSALLYAIIRRSASCRAAVFASLMFTLLPISLTLSAVLTNQQLSLFFVLLALLTLDTDTPDWKRGVLAGILLGIANIARADVIIVPLAVFVAGLLLLNRKTLRLQPDGNQREVLAALLCMAVYYAFGKLIELPLRQLQPYGLQNHFPLYKFAVGLNAVSGGRYSEALNLQLIENPAYIADTLLRDADTKQLILQELSVEPVRLLRLLLQKCRYAWSCYGHRYELFHAYDSGAYVSLGALRLPVFTMERLLMQMDSLMRMALFGANAAAGVRLARRNGRDWLLLICVLCVLAFSAVSLVIEVQYRYAYLVMPMFCMVLCRAGKRENAK